MHTNNRKREKKRLFIKYGVGEDIEKSDTCGGVSD